MNTMEMKTIYVYFFVMVTTSYGLSKNVIGDIWTWKQFFVDFVQRYDRPRLVYLVDAEEVDWVKWMEKIIPFISKQTRAEFSVIPVYKNFSMNGEGTYYSLDNMLSTYNWAWKMMRPLFLIASFRTKEEITLMSQVLQEETFEELSLLLIADNRLREMVSHCHFPHLNQAIITKYEDDGTISILDAYQLDKKQPVNINQNGVWIPSIMKSSNEKRANTGRLVYNDEDNVIRRSDFMGKKLKCVTLEYEPFTVFKRENEKIQHGGWFFDIMNIIKDVSNFTFECHEPHDGQWGAVRNGEWVGMVKDVLDGNSDFVLAPLDHTTERATAIDFAFSISNIGYHMVMRRPSKVDATWSSYVMELTMQSWGVVVIFIIVLVITLPLITKSSPREDIKVSVTDTILLIIGALSFNVITYPVTSISSRVTMFTLYVFAFVIMAHYNAFLTSSLTVTSTSLPFTTLEGMLQNGKYDFGFPGGISLEEQFKKTPNPIYQKVWSTYIRNRENLLPKSDDEGVARVKKENYVHLIGLLNYQSLFGQDCGTLILKQGYMEAPSSFAMRKRSPLRKVFNYHLGKVRETGALAKLWAKWKPQMRDCTSTDGRTVLGIWNVMTAFMLLIFFMVVAWIILLVEKISYNKSVSVVTSFTNKP